MNQTDECRQRLADVVAAKYDADVLIFSGDTLHETGNRLREVCENRARKHPNVVLLLSTYGGTADGAYQIARCLQRSYKKVVVVVDGICKSAGTLIVLGCDELVMSDYGELGPLDVQILRDDEYGERRSGMTPTRALISLEGQAFRCFEQHFLKIRGRLMLTSKLAAEIASNMAVGLFSQIYGQVDPMRLGETDRAMDVADHYGRRLSSGRSNVKSGTLARLLAGYPSHGFVIDRQEAKELFNHVRSPVDEEKALLEAVRKSMRTPDEQATIDFLSSTETAILEQGQGAGRGDDAAGENAPGDRGDQARAEPPVGGPHRPDGGHGAPAHPSGNGAGPVAAPVTDPNAAEA